MESAVLSNENMMLKLDGPWSHEMRPGEPDAQNPEEQSHPGLSVITA